MKTKDGTESTSRSFRIKYAKWPAEVDEEGVPAMYLPVCVDIEVNRSKNEGTLEIKARALIEPSWETLGSASYKRGKKQLKLNESFPASYTQSLTTTQELAGALASEIVKDYEGSPYAVRYAMKTEDFEGNLRESLASGLKKLVVG